MFKRCLSGCLLAGIFAGIFGYPPLAGAQGVDSYTKLMLHADGSDQGTSFTDSETTPKTVTNTESYDSYTKLMLHMENNVTDSAAGKTVTNNNATFTSSVYKMGGYSGVLNGSNAYLSLPNSNDYDFGSGDFTIDFWIYINGSQANDVGIINFGNTQGDPSDTNWVIYFQSTTTIRFLTGASTDWNVNVDFTGISTGTWLHLAVVRTGNDYKTFTNGVLGNTVTNSSAIQDINSPLEIGRWVRTVTSRTEYFNGWIDELRISKGIARWTSNFTPPSSPYGKVYTVTGTKKFGTASGEFKGSGEYLSLADSDDWNFGSGDFTIDTWVRFNTVGIYQIIAHQGNPSSNGDLNIRINFYQDGTLYFFYSSTGSSWDDAVGFQFSPSTNTWYHLAIVRNGANLKVFKDGTQIGSTHNIGTTTLFDSTSELKIGAIRADSFPLDGWIDEFRISKGIARWTSNFTLPTAPYDEDTTAPTVSSTSPASSSTGVGVSSAISATFSEDMDSSTITTSTFTLSSSSGSSGNSIRQAQDRSVGWVKRSAPNETGDDEDGFWKATPPSDPLQRGTVDGFASLNPSYTKNAFTPTSSSVSGTVSYSNKVATFTPSSNLSYSTTYTATITTGVKDTAGNAMSSTYTWSFTTSSAPDTTAPTGSVSGASYTNSSTVTLTLSATDNVGVTGYYVSDSSTTPSASASGWTSVTSTTSYSGTVSYSLSSGEGSKTIYAWYKDAAGNVSSTASDTITLDTTAPTVSITSPTTSTTYTATSSTITLSGSASDSSSGISAVSWSNSKGGSGTASGTASWTISSISLSSGDNVITVTAKDGAGNSGTDTITVTYTATTAQPPTVSTGSATNVTSTSATLTGTVNAKGLSTTAWFEYSTISGSYTNKSSTQTVTGSNDTTVSIAITGLTSGTTYYYRIAAQNNSGTSYGSEMTFQYNPGGSAPTVTTDSASDVTTTSVTLNGTANANGISTTAWFEYGTLSGTYGNKTTTKSVSGSTDAKVSIGISGLTANTTYYYRIVAQNSVGTSYG